MYGQLPPTRAKSPKLGRRKSNNGAVNSSEGVIEKGAAAQRKHRTSNTNNSNSSDVTNDSGLDGLKNKTENETEHTELIEEINMVKVDGQAGVEICSQ